MSTEVCPRIEPRGELSQLQARADRMAERAMREHRIEYWKTVTNEYATASEQAIEDVSKTLDLLCEVAERVGEVCWRQERNQPLPPDVKQLREIARNALAFIQEQRSMNDSIIANAPTTKPIATAWGIWDSDPSLKDGGRWLKWYDGHACANPNAFMPLVCFEDSAKAAFYAAEYADDIEATTGNRPHVRVASLTRSIREPQAIPESARSVAV
jgi:hypothetical protein